MTEAHPGDSELVARSLDGDDQAFAELSRRHEGMVRSIIQRHASRAAEEVEDLAQQAFVTAFRKLENLNDPSRFHAWLWGITSRICWKWAAARPAERDRGTVPIDVEGEEATLGANADQGMRHELRARIASALAGLAPEYQEVLLLRFLDGLEQDEIAELTDRTPGSVRGIVTRGTRILRDQLVTTWNELNPGSRLDTGEHLPNGIEEVLRSDEKSVMVIAEDHTIVAVNAPWARHTGFEVEHAIGAKCYAISHGRDTPCSGTDHPCPMQLIAESARQASVVHHHKTASGDDEEVLVMTMPVDQELTSGRKRRFYVESIEPRDR